MDGYSSVNNQVILAIKSGRGFSFLEQPLVIEANLNGHALRTDLLQPSNEILIGAELLWEAERKVLKRLRTGNVPLKVECFSITSEEKQEKVGYVLLPLRAAKYESSNGSTSNVSATWHSLLGVKTEFKNYCPSLFLCLFIVSENVIEKNALSKECISDKDTSEVKCIPQILLNCDTIQIGPQNHSTCVFVLTVQIESIAWSEENITGTFHFICDILGCPKRGASASRLSSLPSATGNKFEIKVLSSLENLRDYFQDKELASIKILCNGKDIAFGNISGSCLIPTEDAQSLFSVTNTFSARSRCYLKKTHMQQISNSSLCCRPYVDTVVSLQYLYPNCKGLGQGDMESCNITPPSCETFNLCANVSWNLQNTNNYCKVYSDTQKHQNMSRKWFMLNVMVENILINKSFGADAFYFRFNQPNSVVILKHTKEIMIDEVNQWIPLQGVACSFLLEGSQRDVLQELTLHKPNIETVQVVDQTINCLGNGNVDISLCLEEKVNYTSLVKLQDALHQECGVLKIQFTLEEILIVSENLKKTLVNEENCTLSLNAHAATKAAQGFEEWKEQQEKQFIIELKEKECRHLNALIGEWENRLKEYELVLNNNIQHCSDLAASLSCATDELCEKSQVIAQKETELSQMKESLKVEYQSKIHECREASRRMEDDFKLEISRLQTENSRHCDQIILLEKENERLLELQKETEIELQKLKRNSLTEDQTAALLKELKIAEEKYENAHRSKIFFKEQWARTVREIHIMKSKHREDMNAQIKSNKEELKILGKILLPGDIDHSVSLESYSHANPANAAQPESENLSNIDLDSFSTSHQNCQPGYLEKVEVENTLQKSFVEQKLQELVQERDKLLNTGSYSLDHVLITKLNKQIRELLAESDQKFV